MLEIHSFLPRFLPCFCYLYTAFWACVFRQKQRPEVHRGGSA